MFWFRIRKLILSYTLLTKGLDYHRTLSVLIVCIIAIENVFLCEHSLKISVCGRRLPSVTFSFCKTMAIDACS